MPSNYFTYSPTAGTGNATISVSANTDNTGTTDNLAYIMVNNSSTSATVNLRQLYRPRFTLTGGNTFPNSGGSLYFTVNTEYDIAFWNIPSWITIKRNQTIYSNGTRISKGVANGSTFAIIAQENSGASRDDNHMCMGHYINNDPQLYFQEFGIEQEAAEAVTVEEEAEVSFDISLDNEVTVVVSAITLITDTDRLTYTNDGGEEESTVWTYDARIQPGGDIEFGLYVENYLRGPLTVHIDYNEGAEGTVGTLTEGDTLSFITTYVPGAKVVFTVEE